MQEHLLVPIDGSEQAREAFEYALDRFPDAELTLLSVVDPADAVVSEPITGAYESPAGTAGAGAELLDELETTATERVEETASEARAAGHDADSEVVVGQPGRAIVVFADERDCDHIVMGSHGRSGVSRVLLGSVAESVMRRAHAPVTVVR